MGGNPPLGYDVPATGTHILQVNEAEAVTVRHIFARYLELGSVHALQRDLTALGIVSKQRVTISGKEIGGLPFSRGALFHLLRNQIYLGRIPHKGIVHEGSHVAIVELALFETVQQPRDAQARRHRTAGEQRTARASLTGRLFDAMDESMTPTFSRGRSGRLYRYCVSASLQKGAPRDDDRLMRLPAIAIEKLVGELVIRLMPHASAPLDIPLAIRLREKEILLDQLGNLAADISVQLQDGERLLHSTRQTCRIGIPLTFHLRGGKKTIAIASRTAKPDQYLIKALRKAHSMMELHRGLPFIETAPVTRYNRDTLLLAFLAPDIQRDILADCQPSVLNLDELRHMEIPLCWQRQREVLGWTANR